MPILTHGDMEVHVNLGTLETIANAKRLAKAGFRPISIALHQLPSDIYRHTIVWVKRDGPDWALLPVATREDVQAYLGKPQNQVPPAERVV